MKGVPTDAWSVLLLLSLVSGCANDRIGRQQKEPGKLDIPEALIQVLPKTVIVLGADIIDGRIKIKSAGSGALRAHPTSASSEIWTSRHIVAKSVSELRDVFIIGASEQYGIPPTFVCAGVPSSGKIFPKRDLVRLVCDRNLLGEKGNNALIASDFPTAKFATKTNATPKTGDPIWIFGFGNSSGNRLAIAKGVLLENQRENSDQLLVKASITLGFSGGPAVDRHGRLLGIASGFRIATNREHPKLREKIAIIREIPETDVDF